VAESALAQAVWSWLLFFDGQCRDARKLAGKVLNGPHPPAQAIIWASASSTAATGFTGDDPASIFTHGLTVANAHADEMPWGQFEIEIGACLAYMALGNAHRAQEIAEAGYRSALSIGVPLMVSGWGLFAGLAAMARGNLATAERLLREGVSGFTDNDFFRLQRCCTGALAGVAAVRGRPKAARQWLDRTSQLESSCNQVFLPWLKIWESWALLAGGDQLQAAAQLRQAAALAQHLGLPAIEAEALYCLWRQNIPTSHVEAGRIRSLAGTSPATAAMHDAATGMSQKDGALILKAADEFERLGQDLLAAEAATAGVTALQAKGYGPIQRAMAKAALLRRRCRGARTPHLLWAAASDPLTAREREIALLALNHSSKEIAATLGLATTTVNNNIARACTKLGVSGRTGLRTVFS
jgi:DNA-binding CsgD family transcriptional regulator